MELDHPDDVMLFIKKTVVEATAKKYINININTAKIEYANKFS